LNISAGGPSAVSAAAITGPPSDRRFIKFRHAFF
jgi:hypothetical protein